MLLNNVRPETAASKISITSCAHALIRDICKVKDELMHYSQIHKTKALLTNRPLNKNWKIVEYFKDNL